ncbi:MAG: SprT family zinc-dependent metalloprotease [Clostridia bacterium]
MALSYQLIRSDRRTLSLAVNRQGALVVRAPRKMAVVDIERFVNQKQAWILKKQEAAHQWAHAPLCMENGASFPYLGGTLEIRLCEVTLPTHASGLLFLPQNNAEASLRAWRRQQADQVLRPLVAKWSGVMGLSPTSITYTRAKQRWGSMSTLGALRLNEALVHLPMALIDYVVVHELSHRVYPNHSPAFHAYVRRILPNADALRAQIHTMAYVTTLLP